MVGVNAQGEVNRRDHPLGKLGRGLGQRNEPAFGDATQGVGDTVAFEGGAAAGELVEQRTEGEDVGASVDEANVLDVLWR